MRLILPSNTLPQLAVLAKILFLLMVVMCGAMPAVVRSVSLYSTCSSGNITVTHRSIVAAGRTEHNAPYQELSTQSEDFSRKLYIYAEKSRRYICFTRKWKLVTRRQKRPLCQFFEVYNGSYLRYKSVIDESRFMGFNKNGRPVRNPHARRECYNFIKYNPNADINRHNSVVNAEIGGMEPNLVSSQMKSSQEKPAKKKNNPLLQADSKKSRVKILPSPTQHRLRHSNHTRTQKTRQDTKSDPVDSQRRRIESRTVIKANK